MPLPDAGLVHQGSADGEGTAARAFRGPVPDTFSEVIRYRHGASADEQPGLRLVACHRQPGCSMASSACCTSVGSAASAASWINLYSQTSLG